MTEEVKVETQEVVVEATAPEYSDIEKRAMEMGWRPKTEFHGDEVDFVDAKEFVGRKPLFDKIDTQSRQLKATIKALEEFKNHYTKVNENAYERALASLKNERKQALTEGDGDKFEQIDDQIKAVEKQVEEVRAVRAQPVVQEEAAPHPEFAGWKSRNSWYDSVAYMRKFADDFGTPLALRGVPPAEVLKQVEEAVRKEFPHRFTNPNKASAPDVETSAGRTTKQGSQSLDWMTDLERKVMNDLDRTKVLKKEDYIKDLKKLKGIA